MPSLINTSRIAIVGLGQLGASLAMRIKELGCLEIYGIARRDDLLIQAVDQGVIDQGSSEAADILPVVDLTIICLPLDATIEFVEKNIESFRVGSIVTDVGSVKGSVVNSIRNKLFDRGVYFIGGHPMAGTEKSGLENANPRLYDDAICFLTPTKDDDEDMINIVSQFWQDIGSEVIEIDAARHDSAVAYCSHHLHLLSAGLAQVVLSHEDSEAHLLACAGGFRDMSRIAASDSKMWTQISRHNKDALLKSMNDLAEEMESYKQLIEADNWDAVELKLKDASDNRQNWAKNEAKDRGLLNNEE